MNAAPNNLAPGGNGDGKEDQDPHTEWSDRDLLVQLQQHQDERALAVLHERYRDLVQKSAERVLRGKQLDIRLAEDVAQTIFLILWEHPERFDGSRNPCGLLCTMAHDRAIDFARREGHYDPQELDLEGLFRAAADDSLCPHDKRAFWSCVESVLTAAQFRIVVRLYKQDLPIHECAAMEGVTPGAVKTGRYDALKKLKGIKFLLTFLPSHSDMYRSTTMFGKSRRLKALIPDGHNTKQSMNGLCMRHGK